MTRPPPSRRGGAGGAFQSRVHLDGMPPSSRWKTSAAARRGTHIVLLALCVTAATPAALRAQIEGSTLPTGVRVRVHETSTPQPFTGTLWHVSGDTYAVRPSGTNTLLKLSESRIVSIDVSAGRDRVRWGFLGAAAGALAGGLFGAATIGQDPDADLGSVGGVVLGSFVGAPLGAVVGALNAPERWRRIRLDR
jgi:hypothetical protein